MLGIPTIADRVAQTVVAEELKSKVEMIFHDDSYGYRPGRSTLDAVAVCRQRCWTTDWVIDLDIQKFFDSVSWELMLKAVGANTDLPWVMLYVRRWLQAPVQLLRRHPATALIAGRNDRNILPSLALAPRGRNVKPRNVNEVC